MRIYGTELRFNDKIVYTSENLTKLSQLENDLPPAQPGPEGPEGPQGPQGQQGPIGADGLSAYEVAVKNGFVGTEEEWLNSYIKNEPKTFATSTDIDSIFGALFI